MLLIVNQAIDPNFGKYPGTFGGSWALQILLNNTIAIILIISSVVAILLLLFGGFEYITAGGDKEATQKSTKRITSAVIGLVLVFSTFAIIKLVETLFGISILNFSIPFLK